MREVTLKGATVAYSDAVLTMVTLMALLQTAEPVFTPVESQGVTLDDRRVKRFVGALIGGAIGLAIPLAVSAPAANCGDATVCSTSFQNLTIGFMPLVGGLGAYFGHHLFGGQAEYPFATLGAGLGSLLGMMVLAFAQGIGVRPTALFPYVASVAGLTTFLMAFLLDARTYRIGALPPEAHGTGARLWATFGSAVGLGIAGGFVSLLIGVLNPFVGLVVGALFLSALPVVSWAVHSRLGGRGSLASAFWGLLVSVGTLAAVVVPVQVITRGGSAFYAGQQGALLTGAAFLSLLIGPLIGLELSHTDVVEAGVRPVVSLAPLAGGAMVGGGFRF